jgi:hypothetical protein
MSDREISGTDCKDSEQTALYSLEIELEAGEDRSVKLVNVHNHSLRSGFMVVEYAGGEQSFRASDIVRTKKSYM